MDIRTTSSRYEIIPDSKETKQQEDRCRSEEGRQTVDAISLAADPDREGEAICQHLAEEIVPKKPKTPAYRVMFNEITKRAVQGAFEHPKQIDGNLVDAQQARRVLDRLVGYKVSPLLCKTIGGRLSAGRVQSVALRMVVEREREIESFVKTEYWTIGANLAGKQPPPFAARLLKVGDQTLTPAASIRPQKTEILIGAESQAKEMSPRQKQTFVVSEGHHEGAQAESRPAVYYLEAATGSRAQARFFSEEDDDAGAALYGVSRSAHEGFPSALITYIAYRLDAGGDRVSGMRQFVDTQFARTICRKGVHYRSKKGAQDARSDSSYRCGALAGRDRAISEPKTETLSAYLQTLRWRVADDARALQVKQPLTFRPDVSCFALQFRVEVRRLPEGLSGGSRQKTEEEEDERTLPCWPGEEC